MPTVPTSWYLLTLTDAPHPREPRRPFIVPIPGRRLVISTVQTGQVRPTQDVPAFARRPVLLIAGAVGLVLLAFSNRYGYFGDELYFLAAGRHLSWGYADQPWLVPLVARVMDTVTGGSLVGLRLPAILVTATGVVVTALIARELGGERRAQIMAAGAFAVSSYLIGTGHLLATSTLDPFGWTVITWLVVRWVRTREQGHADDRLLLLAGVATALTMQVKFLIPAFWVALGISVLALGPRDMLRRPLLWAGAAVTVVVTVPTLIWQARNGWPYLALTKQVSDEMDYIGGRYTFVPLALVLAGVAIGAVLACYGLWRLLRAPELAPYRFLGATTLGVVAIMIAANGRAYYAAGMYGLLWAVAAVELQRHRPAIWWRWFPTWPVYLLSAVVAVSGLPWQPVSWHANKPRELVDFQLDEIGWPYAVDGIGAVYRSLPAPQQRHTVVIGDIYWIAAAVDRFGPESGLPEAYSPSRGYYYLGVPPADTDTAVVVGFDAATLRKHFAEVHPAGKLDNGVGVNNDTQGSPMWVCEGPRAPWSQLWPQLRTG